MPSNPFSITRLKSVSFLSDIFLDWLVILDFTESSNTSEVSSSESLGVRLLLDKPSSCCFFSGIRSDSSKILMFLLTTLEHKKTHSIMRGLDKVKVLNFYITKNVLYLKSFIIIFMNIDK